MAMSENAAKARAAEDQLISVAAPRLVALLEDHMSAALGSWQMGGELLAPNKQLYYVSLLEATFATVTEVIPKLLIEADAKTTTAAAVRDYVNRYAEQRGLRLSQTTEKQLRRLILAGQRRGLSTDEVLAKLRSSIPKLAGLRAQTIATTEIHTAAQFVTYRQAVSNPAITQKAWFTQEDDRVRGLEGGFSHRAMHLTEAGVGRLFQVPHAQGYFEGLRFCGDPEGSAGNVVNCRCQTHYR